MKCIYNDDRYDLYVARCIMGMCGAQPELHVRGEGGLAPAARVLGQQRHVPPRGRGHTQHHHNTPRR